MCLTLQKVFEFLGVDKNFYTPKFAIVKHESSVKRRKNSIGMIFKMLSETQLAQKFSVDFRRKFGKIIYLPFSKKIERPVLTEELRNFCIEKLSDDIEKLKEFTGMQFDEWSI